MGNCLSGGEPPIDGTKKRASHTAKGGGGADVSVRAHCGPDAARSRSGSGRDCDSSHRQSDATSGIDAEIAAALAAAAAEVEAGRSRHLREHYELGPLIGHGAFAKVYQATHIESGDQVAVKLVALDADAPETQLDGIVKEVAIMRMLQDHPNAVFLREVFALAPGSTVLDGGTPKAAPRGGGAAASPMPSPTAADAAGRRRLRGGDSAASSDAGDTPRSPTDPGNGPVGYALVMELCAGGELFDQIVEHGHFSEADGARHMAALLRFISFCHAKRIVHRDLKPENILLGDKGPGAVLKVIDFGTSDFCRPGQRLSQKFGTPYYVAPEVLRRDYDFAADVWSAGVILYILLSGYPPFSGRSDARILQKVTQGSYSFAAKEWNDVSEDAKHCISCMLVLDPAERHTAKQLLSHRWFLAAPEAPVAALGEHIIHRLRGFASMTRMKRLALVLLAHTLTDTDVARLRELFSSMDTDSDGRIDAADLKAAVTKNNVMTAAEMDELICASDLRGTHSIDYEEFLAAMLDSDRVAKRRNAVKCSFDLLDRDGDGFISVSDLVQVIEEREQRIGCLLPAVPERHVELEHDSDEDGDGGSTTDDGDVSGSSEGGSSALVVPVRTDSSFASTTATSHHGGSGGGGGRRREERMRSLDLARHMVEECHLQSGDKLDYESFKTMWRGG